MRARRHAPLLFALAPVALKIAAMLWARHAGFEQVSDDDYARTVIAQTFAHAPRLDPSGTSWLPFPFWLYGGLMMAFGRSLATARAIAFVLGALAPLLLYAGLRSLAVSRAAASGGAALASLTPWSVWLGLAPVPEAWAGACIAASLFFLGSGEARRAPLAGGLALVAALSRYEAWPVAALVAIVCAARFVRSDRSRALHLAGLLLAIAGPLFWLANNALAHGDALHFVARVTAYRRAHAGAIPLRERLLEYPRALAEDAPEMLAALVVGALGAWRSRAMRARWVLPIGGALLVLAFLIYGDVRDGAPTHHAARALLPTLSVLAGFGADGLESLVSGRRALAPTLAAFAAAWLVAIAPRIRYVPGNEPESRRDAQIARGRALAGARALDVVPCAYEHFALIAAYGAPERVTVEEAPRQAVTPECPIVVTQR